MVGGSTLGKTTRVWMAQENLYSEFGGAVSALPGETVAVLTAVAEASTSRGEAGDGSVVTVSLCGFGVMGTVGVETGVCTGAGDGSAATGGAQLQARFSVPVFLVSTGRASCGDVGT